VRRIARFGVPVGIVAGVLALAGAVLVVVNLAVGGGVWSVLASVAMAVFWGRIAYGVGLELPRNVREWDAELAARDRAGR
jgi:hypothetical protein